MDVDKFKTDIQDLISTNDGVSVVLDTVHLHQYGKIIIFIKCIMSKLFFIFPEDLLKEFQRESSINICKITENNNYVDMVVIFCGTDKRKLRNWAFIANGKNFVHF